MPTYEYACKECGHTFEAFQSMRDEPLKKCPKCRRSALKRLVGSGAGLIFKGSGFYITDYKNKPAGKGEGGGEGKSGDGKGSEGKGGEGKGGEGKAADGKASEGKASEKKSSSESKPASDSKPGSAKSTPDTPKK